LLRVKPGEGADLAIVKQAFRVRLDLTQDPWDGRQARPATTSGSESCSIR
jgi:hypothetical protein